jgi:hypothetical protein
MVVVLIVFTPDYGIKPHLINQRTVQPPHRSWAGFQAVYQYKMLSLSQGTETSVHTRAEVQCE